MFPADMVEHLCNRVVKYGLWRTVHEMRESVFAVGKENDNETIDLYTTSRKQD